MRGSTSRRNKTAAVCHRGQYRQNSEEASRLKQYVQDSEEAPSLAAAAAASVSVVALLCCATLKALLLFLPLAAAMAATVVCSAPLTGNNATSLCCCAGARRECCAHSLSSSSRSDGPRDSSTGAGCAATQSFAVSMQRAALFRIQTRQRLLQSAFLLEEPHGSYGSGPALRASATASSSSDAPYSRPRAFCSSSFNRGPACSFIVGGTSQFLSSSSCSCSRRCSSPAKKCNRRVCKESVVNSSSSCSSTPQTCNSKATITNRGSTRRPSSAQAVVKPCGKAPASTSGDAAAAAGEREVADAGRHRRSAEAQWGRYTGPASPERRVTVSLEKLRVFCREKGLLLPAAEAYGGLRGTVDFGVTGWLLLENIRSALKRFFLHGAPSLRHLTPAEEAPREAAARAAAPVRRAAPAAGAAPEPAAGAAADRGTPTATGAAEGGRGGGGGGGGAAGKKVSRAEATQPAEKKQEASAAARGAEQRGRTRTTASAANRRGEVAEGRGRAAAEEADEESVALGPVYAVETAALGPPALWRASGHEAHFFDALVQCTDTGKVLRVEDLWYRPVKTPDGAVVYELLVNSSEKELPFDASLPASPVPPPAAAAKNAEEGDSSISSSESSSSSESTSESRWLPLSTAPRDIFRRLRSPFTGREAALSQPQQQSTMLRVLLRHGAAGSAGSRSECCGGGTQDHSDQQRQEQQQVQRQEQQQRQQDYERERQDVPQRQLQQPQQQLQQKQLLQLDQQTDAGTAAAGLATAGLEGNEDEENEETRVAEQWKTADADAAGKGGDEAAEASSATDEQQQEWAVLRPETAQNVLLEYEELLPKFLASGLPFGLAQEGRAWRREAAGAPRLLFRLKEFRQFEIEYFFDPRINKPDAVLKRWQQELFAFFKSIGLPENLLHVVERDKKDLAHYALRCVDICYSFPFGVEEICGIAYRADVDLNAHHKHTTARRAGVKEKAAREQAAVRTPAVGSLYRGTNDERQSDPQPLPHVIEPSLGLERLLLALLLSAFVKDEVKGKERIFLNLHPAIAPFKAAIMPVVSNVEALTRESERLCDVLRRNGLATVLENSSASIGRRCIRRTASPVVDLLLVPLWLGASLDISTASGTDVPTNWGCSTV